jgi:hypothetical protein
MALAAVAHFSCLEGSVAVPAPAMHDAASPRAWLPGLIGGAIVSGAIASQNGYYNGPG